MSLETETLGGQSVGAILWGLLASVVAFVGKNLFGAISSQQKQIDSLMVNLAQNYVPRHEIDAREDKINSKLDRVDDKLDQVLSELRRGHRG